MRTQIRIVAGSLRGRKLTCTVDVGLRPTPDMVRQALFSILGDAVPDRPFFDVFAGTGVVGLEAISRGASEVTFVERDFRRLAEIEEHLRQFGVADRAQMARTDVYRWAERWLPPDEPVNVFLSPPFADYERRPEDLMAVAAGMQERTHPGSVVVLQADREVPFNGLPDAEHWEERRYGRNQLLIWVKESEPSPTTEEP
jgi:16S rRNA (guanine(966)-N(2))-methyltransferase RsmD